MQILKTISDKDFGLNTTVPDSYLERRAARGIVFDKDHNIALLHSKNKNYVKIPGGGIEAGEKTVDALKREVREEVGCEIDSIKELGIIEEYWNKLAIHQLSSYFIAYLVGEKGTPKFEQDEIEDDFETLWINIDVAIKLLDAETIGLENYRGKFINARDIFCLKEIKKIIQ